MEEGRLVVPTSPTFQTPPEVKIRIQASNTDIIRLASMGSTRDLGGFLRDREYWRQCAFTSNTFDGALTLTSNPFANDEGEASLRDTFFTTTAPWPVMALDVSRTNATWNNSERSVPAGRNAFLYEMAHPDGGTNPAMGVLFELDQRTNLLLAVVFYVAASWTSPPSSPLWNTKEGSPFPLTLSKKDSIRTKELPDPPSGKSWWHTVMG